MKKGRFDRLVTSLHEVRSHVAGGPFAGRINEIEVGAGDIRTVRERSGMTQQQFAAAFGTGLAHCRSGNAASAARAAPQNRCCG
ncbi:MAG: helix-turn-helix domain-containing protein [Pseudomonadota bacterium]